jgi:hypothetical protein
VYGARAADDELLIARFRCSDRVVVFVVFRVVCLCRVDVTLSVVSDFKCWSCSLELGGWLLSGLLGCCCDT